MTTEMKAQLAGMGRLSDHDAPPWVMPVSRENQGHWLEFKPPSGHGPFPFLLVVLIEE
jgi:hypothetical protein